MKGRRGGAAVAGIPASSEGRFRRHFTQTSAQGVDASSKTCERRMTPLALLSLTLISALTLSVPRASFGADNSIVAYQMTPDQERQMGLYINCKIAANPRS